MSILTRDDSGPFSGGSGGCPRRDWTEKDIEWWVKGQVERITDPFYRQWTLANHVRHPAEWLDRVHDDITCWDRRLAALREALRAIGDPRAEQECPVPDWPGWPTK